MAACWLRLYNLNYLAGRLHRDRDMEPVTSYYVILAAPGSGLMMANTPWSGQLPGSGRDLGAMTAHTTQFTQPGWTYDNPSCGYLAKGGSLTYLSPDRKSCAEQPHREHRHRGNRRLSSGIQGGTLARVVGGVGKPTVRGTFAHVAELKPVHPSLTLTINPDSLYTLTNTTGQGREMLFPLRPPASRCRVWRRF